MPRSSTRRSAAPDGYDTLKARIAERYSALSPQLTRIAEFALANPAEVAFGTASTIAGRVAAQPSSLVRFAHALGYAGFSDMQRIFRARLAAGMPSYAERIDTLRRGRADGAVDSVLHDFVDAGVAALQELGAHTPPGRMAEAVALLACAHDIYLLARQRSFPVAFYLGYALTRLGRRCHVIDGIGGMLGEQAALAMADDVLVTVTFRPYSPEVVEATAQAAARGVPVVTISDGALSPVAGAARVAFEVTEPHDRAFRTLIAPMCLAQALVVGLGHHLANQGGKAHA